MKLKQFDVIYRCCDLDSHYIVGYIKRIYRKKFLLCWVERNKDNSDYEYESLYNEAELLKKYKIIGNIKSKEEARTCAIILKKLLCHKKP